MTQIFLTGAGTFPDPGNWDPTANTVECVGGGGNGFLGGGMFNGSGGGAGAYAIGTNLALIFPVPYNVGSPPGGGATNFNVSGSAPSTQPGCVSAQSGGNASTTASTGGAGGTAFYPSGFPGGAGGNDWGSGGGAAGPHGAGGAGGANPAPGGAGDNGNTPGGVSYSSPNFVYSNGGNGTQWDASHGVGGGGGGAISVGGPAGGGGMYGGGEGGIRGNPD